MDQKVIKFINHFTAKGRKDQVIDTFLNGCCYWFAFILFQRFKNEAKTEIVYDVIENHYACRINGKVYDIRGEVPDKYNWILWDDVWDPRQREYLTRDCIKFEEMKEDDL